MWKFTQHSFAGGVQDTRLTGRQDLERYWTSAKTLDNFLVERQGCIQKRRGTDLIHTFGGEYSNAKIRLIPFVFERDKSYVLAFIGTDTDSIVKVFTVSENGYQGVIASISTPYKADELEAISYVQSGDVVILAHRNHPPARITRSSGNSFSYDVIDFKNLGGNPLPDPPNIRLDVGKGNVDSVGTHANGTIRTVYYAATAVGNDGRESPLGTILPQNYATPWANGFVMTIQIADENNSAITEPPDGVAYYNIYKKTTGEFGLIGNTKGQRKSKQITNDEGEITHTEYYYDVLAFHDDFITPNTAMTPPVVKDFFTTESDYPDCVALVDQRLIFAATNAAPYTVWWSTVGDLFNFNEHETVRDDDGFSANIPATELPRINHIVAMRNMLIFSDGGEWVAEPVSGEALTLKSLSFKHQSQVGCHAELRPTIIEDKIVFADSTGETVRTIDYSYERDGYITQNLTILSQSLFDENPVRRWAYQQHPDSTLWCVLEDGTIATLAYMQEHELVAWSHQVLGGGLKAEDVVCTKGLTKGCSTVLILAKNADGNYVLLRVRDEINTTDLKDAVCLDSMYTVEIAEEVTPDPVPAGMVAVDSSTGYVARAMRAGRTYYVGYPFSAIMRTIRPEARGQSTIQFELKDAISVELRAGNKSPFLIVPTAIESEPNQAVAAGDGIVAAKGVVDFSPADYVIELAGHSGTNGAVTLICDDPYPFQLLSYSVNYELDPRTIGVN